MHSLRSPLALTRSSARLAPLDDPIVVLRRVTRRLEALVADRATLQQVPVLLLEVVLELVRGLPLRRVGARAGREDGGGRVLRCMILACVRV